MGRFLDFEGVDAVVFDCDGVLVDSEPVSQRCWAETLAEFGVEMEGPFSRWAGRTDAAIAEHHAALAGVPAHVLLDRAAAVLADVVEREGVDVYSDTAAALERLGGGVLAAVATNSERWRLDLLLKAAGMADWFDAAVASDDVAHPKPAPDVYLRAAELLGIEPGRCLVVEDSPTGVAAARAANMRVVALDRGMFPLEELAPATRVVQRLE